MSSRALRKLQKEQELQRQLEQAKREYEEQDEEESDSEVAPPTQPSRIKNAFDMLEGVDDEEDSDQNDSEPVQPQISRLDAPAETDSVSRPSPSSKSKKKKKKAKKKTRATATESTPPTADDGDEIDRALREINAKNQSRASQADEQEASPTWDVAATKLLAIEEKNLNPVNEMKSLFGSVALEGEGSRTPNRNPRRREVNQAGGVDLATALTGRYSHASRGKELGALASRRNIFIQGKEEWPLATSGGLSMELVADASRISVKAYNIMHNDQYKETQMHFRVAVESMDPQRMIGLLLVYPYHIATLLQVSEIAKHQGDHSVSGDLLERALYSFGKSVHSTFPASLRSGTARISFSKPANRELYLAIWRYIKNLEMRGTWKTAFEWSKILLQLEPVNDPFGVTLMIDQFALRGRQHTKFLDLCSDDGFGSAWSHLPNIQISLALAHLKIGKPREARQQLALAIHKYPYILSALASALDVSPLPKSLWAKLPSSDAEKLYTQLYVTRAKDLWTSPETTSLLVEVAETLSHYPQPASASKPPKLEISLEEARHIMLLEIPHLIALLPRRFTTMQTSSSDVLPPPNSESDLVRRAPGGQGAQFANSPMQTIFNAAGATAGATGTILQRMINWFAQPAGTGQDESEGQAALRLLQEELGGDVPPEMIEQFLQIHLNEAHGDGDEFDPTGLEAGMNLGIPGAWGVEEDADAANEYEEENYDSMPELEDAPASDSPNPPAPSGPRNPRAAMVEEEEEDDDDEYPASQSTQPRNNNTASLGGAILRRVESDDDIQSTAPAPLQPPAAPSVPTSNPPQSSSVTSPPTTTTTPDFNDPQRLQRWLLTTGLTELQADTSASTLNTYVSRLQTLRKPQQEWIVNMVRQRAGSALEARVRGALT